LRQWDYFVAFHHDLTLPPLLQTENASQQLQPALQRSTAMGGTCFIVFVMFAVSVIAISASIYGLDTVTAVEQLVPSHVFDPSQLVDAMTGADVRVVDAEQEGLDTNHLQV